MKRKEDSHLIEGWLRQIEFKVDLLEVSRSSSDMSAHIDIR
jgi:hypothetical protein